LWYLKIWGSLAPSAWKKCRARRCHLVRLGLLIAGICFTVFTLVDSADMPPAPALAATAGCILGCARLESAVAAPKAAGPGESPWARVPCNNEYWLTFSR
jgi:hypothetical protein